MSFGFVHWCARFGYPFTVMAKKTKQLRVGGFAFFSSLLFLLLLGTLNSCLLLNLWDEQAATNLGFFALGIVPGAFLAMYFIQGHSSVLVHEFKHALISGLVGNRFRGLKVKKDSGHFEYAYTRETAEYNAFISVAPYVIPLFTFPAVLLAIAFWRHSHELMVAVIGMGYGIDLVMNIRDVSPRQTDLTMIKGGYRVGVLYVAAMNLTILSILLAWVFQGAFGLRYLLFGLWQMMLHVVAYYRGAPAALSS
jgi:hypothetical protein